MFGSDADWVMRRPWYHESDENTILISTHAVEHVADRSMNGSDRRRRLIPVAAQVV
jgi:hypothetical protein